DKDRPEMPEEEDVRERHEDDFLDERPPQRAHGLLDELRTVIERNDAHTRWEARLDLADPGFDAGDDLVGVDIGSCHHHAAHRFVRALDQRSHSERIADPNVCNLLNKYGHTAALANHDVLNVIHRLNETDAADDRPGAVRFDDIASDVRIASANRFDHFAEREAIGPEPVRIEIDLVLLDGSADGCHLGHTGDGIQLVPDEPVLQASQLAERQPIALDRVPEDVPDAGGIRTECRGDACRQ